MRDDTTETTGTADISGTSGTDHTEVSKPSPATGKRKGNGSATASTKDKDNVYVAGATKAPTQVIADKWGSARKTTGEEGALGVAARLEDLSYEARQRASEDFTVRVSNALQVIEEAVNSPDFRLTDLQADMLKDAARGLPPDQSLYGFSFSMQAEIDRQLSVITTMRRLLQTSGENSSSRDMKELISASSTLINMIMKHQEQVRTYERQMKVERSIGEALKKFPEIREAYLKELELRLGDEHGVST